MLIGAPLITHVLFLPVQFCPLVSSMYPSSHPLPTATNVRWDQKLVGVRNSQNHGWGSCSSHGLTKFAQIFIGVSLFVGLLLPYTVKLKLLHLNILSSNVLYYRTQYVKTTARVQCRWPEVEACMGNIGVVCTVTNFQQQAACSSLKSWTCSGWGASG